MASTVWKGQLTFGLVSIPIRIVRAARQEKVRFKQVYRAAQPRAEDAVEPEETAQWEPAAEPERANSPTNYYDAPARGPVAENSPVLPLRREFASQSGAPVNSAEVLKGYEFQAGKFAVFEPQELKRFNLETSREMEILEFVQIAEVDPVFYNTSYYVQPDRGGDKPYALLFEALRKSGYAAMARVAMHGREHVVVLRHGGHGILLHTLFFEAEVHAEDEFHADPNLVTPQELKLADLLVANLAAPFDASKYKDERLARMRASIQSKIEKRDIAETRTEAAKSAPVVDILEALRASLAQKKPAARETPRRARPIHRKAAG